LKQRNSLFAYLGFCCPIFVFAVLFYSTLIFSEVSNFLGFNSKIGYTILADGVCHGLNAFLNQNLNQNFMLLQCWITVSLQGVANVDTQGLYCS
jgi:hypothetical protein